MSTSTTTQTNTSNVLPIRWWRLRLPTSIYSSQHHKQHYQQHPKRFFNGRLHSKRFSNDRLHSNRLYSRRLYSRRLYSRRLYSRRFNEMPCASARFSTLSPTRVFDGDLPIQAIGYTGKSRVFLDDDEDEADPEKCAAQRRIHRHQ